MATGERRMGFSARRGMTVLGKIPAVPKPINLPSQRLENRGLDPSVEIVPRGTFSWATGRSPPTGGSSWGNVGLASSPPLSIGAWNTASNAQAASNPGSSGGGLVQNPHQPLSAGSTPSSSAPTTTRRAWGGAAKLEEQLKHSRFTLTSVDFPTLGSDKNPNLRSQQNMTTSNRPTSADGRHSVYPEESSNRPTSADGTKERQLGYPGIVPSNRPTSADGTFVDKERHPFYSETSPSNRPASADGRHWAYSDIASSNHPPSADGSLVDKQRHPVYMGGVGHGRAGPGLGIYGRFEDNYNLYPSLVRQGIRPPGSRGIPIGPGMYPGSSHHDGFHRSQAPHYGNMEDRETIMRAVGGSPRVYGSYPLHSGSPDLFNRSGVYGRYHPQSGSPEHPGHGTVGIGLQSHGMDIMLSHERPVLGHGRDGYNGIHQEFGEQRGGWAGRDRVHLSMPIDASDNRSPTSIYRTGVELQNSNTSITSWGHHPRHGAWGSISSGDTPMGIYEADASSSIHRPATLREKIPLGIMLEGELKNRYMEEIKGGAGHAGEAKNSLAARRAGDGNKEVLKNEKQPESHLDMVNSKENHVAGKDAAGAAESIDSLSKDMPYQKQEDMPFPAENLTRKEVLAYSESSEKGRNGWVGRSPRGGGDRQPPSSVSVIESGADQPKQATIIIVGRYQLEQDNQGAVSGVNETKDFSRPVPETAVSPAVGFAQLLSKSAEVQVPGAEVSSHQGQSAYQTPKALEEVGGRRPENSEEPPKMVPAAKVAIQTVKESPKGDKKDLKFSKGNNDIQIVDDDSKSRVLDAAKSTNVRRKMPMSCKSTRGTKKDGLPLSLLSERKGATGVSEESLLSSQTSERNRVNGSTSLCADSSVFSGEKPNSAVLSAVEVTCDATHACSESGKKVYTDAYSKSVSDADQVESLKHTETEASFKDENEVPLKPIDDFVVKDCETLSVPSSKEEVQVCNDDGPNKKTKRKAHSLKRFQRDHSLHELHTMDKQHANEGMVWAPVKTSGTVGGIKEETQLCIPKPHTLEQMQQISAESSHQRYAQPMQQQQPPTESRNQRHAQQVQQLQSAESSHQGQGQQMQQQSAIRSKKKQGQQMQEHQPAENSHKKQGQKQSGASIDDQKIQRQSAASSRKKEVQPQQSGESVHREHQQWMQQEQSTAMSFRKQGQETQQKHSVSSSHQEQGQQMLRQFTASSPEVQREVQMKMCPPEDQEEKAGESLPAPVVDKSEPRKNKDGTAIYIPKPARQQQQSAARSNQGQRHVHKGERSFSEDQGKQPFGTSAMPAFIGPESNKNKGESKSYNSKYSRQQAMHQQESLASCNAGERHVHTRERSLPEETGEKSLRTSATPLIAVSEANKDKEEIKFHNPKYVMQQEVQQQQSAAGNHQEHRYAHRRERSLLEEHWKQPTQTPETPVFLGFESSKSKDETKFYIPKHARQQHMHQQQAVTSSHEGQAYRGREAHLSDEELEQSAQSLASPVGEPAKKKDEIELYTSKPARQQQIQQQSTARSHHGQRKARERPLAQEQYQPTVWTSATQVGTGSESSKNKDMARQDGLSDSKGNKDAIQSCAAGSKDDSNSCVSSESNKNKKEIKYYVPKPGRQPQLQRQQSVHFIDQGQKQVSIRERPTPQEKWEIPVQMSAAAPIVTGSESSKRLYTPRPVKKQQIQSATGGHKEERETQTGELSLSEEQWEQQVGNDGSARESGQFSRYRNHPSNPCKSTSSPRVPIKSQPPLVEDGPIDDAIPRASETNGRGLIKEHLKESSSRDPGYHQKNKSSKWQHDVAEARLSKQKQHIHVTKGAESVFDSVRNGSLMSTKFNSTPADNQKRRYRYQPVAQSSQTFKPREQEFEVGYEGDSNIRQLDQGQNRHERHDNGPSRRGWFHGYSYRHANQEG